MEAEGSPFIFDAPLPPEEVFGREAELGALVDRALRPRNVLLYGPRRHGKTSLINRLAFEAAHTKAFVVVLVDFEGVLSLLDITRRLEDAYRRLGDGPVAKAARASLAALARVGFSLSAGPASVAVGHPTPGPTATLERLLDLPWEVSGRTGERILVVFDEFQAIGDVPNADAVICSKIQHQRERVSYLFAGSEQGMLRSIFADRARPLYGQAEQLVLSGLDDVVVVEMITGKFSATGRDPGEALEALVALAAGHPQRVAVLGDALWHATPEGSTADLTNWAAALDAALRMADPEFRALDSGITAVQRRVLRVLAAGEPPFGAAAAHLGLSKASARDALTALVARSIVAATQGPPPPRRYSIVDPLYAAWVRSRRLPAPFPKRI